ncbi:MAG: hypothetical protein AB7K71_25530 [Polyangiaceae bacterium]
MIGPGLQPTWRGRLWFVLSAACVALGAHLSLRSPWIAGGIAAAGVCMATFHLLRRRRVIKTLTGGDPDAVLDLWGPTLDGLPHASTLVPLMAATALAASGYLERARGMLGRASRGPAWEAAFEHRLLLETMLDAFEGEREAALTKAKELEALPLPSADSSLRKRVTALRGALSALARAFARQSQAGDAERLEQASKDTPVLHWALRYAAAIARIERGDQRLAQALLKDAPPWPDESAFSAFHRELSQHAVESPPPHP